MSAVSEIETIQIHPAAVATSKIEENLLCEQVCSDTIYTFADIQRAQRVKSGTPADQRMYLRSTLPDTLQP